MGTNSAIEWTDATWNPVTGCDKISPGCKNCYAERLSLRLHSMGNRRYANGLALTLHKDQLTLPLNNIDWVIVGGESGLKFRPVKAEWVIEIRDQSLDAGVPFFFKQWGGPCFQVWRSVARRSILGRNAAASSHRRKRSASLAHALQNR